MRVLVWGINYSPEPVGIAPYNTALCEHLARKGHEVEMLTTFPYYPSWRKAPEDRASLFRTDLVRGVPVHRCWHFVPAQPNGLRRIFHELSFVASSTLRALSLRRPDAIVVISPPLLLGGAAWLAGAWKRAPHIFHIQDLQPDAAVDLGMVDRAWFIEALRKLERFNYRAAARVSVISEGMRRLLAERGVPEEKLVYFPNGVSPPGEIPARGAFRAAHGIGPEEFVLLYSGNIGVKQGLPTVAAAAAGLPVRMVICGDGAARQKLEEFVRRQKIGNVLLLPLQPEEEYRRMLVDADVCVISQRHGGAAFFPSKLLSCVAFGKPVLAVADAVSELARVVQREGLGRWADPGDAEAVAEAMGAMAADRAELAEFSRRGLAFAARFDQRTLLDEFERVLAAMARR